jgi:hypothetical protein
MAPDASAARCVGAVLAEVDAVVDVDEVAAVVAVLVSVRKKLESLESLMIL